jgi:LL-diaminopimelate aminotransferase
MAILQEGFSQIKREYIFPIIEKKVLDCQKKDLLNLGIGDVALPLAPSVIEAFKHALDEMSKSPIGYPSSHGDLALRQVIFNRYYKNFNLDVSDIFISDGINSDLGNLQ